MFHFVPIERMASVEPGTVVDVLGVVQSFTPAQPLTSKAGREVCRCNPASEPCRSTSRDRSW